MPDSGSPPVGQTLRLSYQLRDATGRTAVDTSSLVLQPLLSFAGGAAPPPGVNATNNQLPTCAASGVDIASGIGECAVVVDGRLFPASGALSTTLVLQLRIGWVDELCVEMC